MRVRWTQPHSDDQAPILATRGHVKFVRLSYDLLADEAHTHPPFSRSPGGWTIACVHGVPRATTRARTTAATSSGESMVATDGRRCCVYQMSITSLFLCNKNASYKSLYYLLQISNRINLDGLVTFFFKEQQSTLHPCTV